jgi:hypothetical protein
MSHVLDRGYRVTFVVSRLLDFLKPRLRRLKEETVEVILQQFQWMEVKGLKKGGR